MKPFEGTSVIPVSFHTFQNFLAPFTMSVSVFEVFVIH